MRPFLISLAVGLAVGIFYGLIKVRSPAPPAIALLGLLGMLAGEQVAPMVRSCVARWEARNGPAPVEPPAPTQAADRGPGDAQGG